MAWEQSCIGQDTAWTGFLLLGGASINNLHNRSGGYISGCVVGRPTNDMWMCENKLI